MVVGELLINLGIKGAEAAGRSLFVINNQVKDLASNSLAAKAAVVGVIYGLERMTSLAGKTGMGLQQFSYATGLSTEMLQKWQYAGAQFGVTGEEMAGTVKSVQDAMTNMLLGKGAPEGMGLLASKVGFDPARARDTFYVMEKLRQFAQSVPPDVGRNLMRSFGISDTMFQFMAKSKQDMDKMPVGLSNGTIKELARIEVAWSRFWTKMKNFGFGLVASHGGGFISELSHAANETIKIAKSFDELLKRSQGIQVLAAAIGAIALVSFAPLTASIVALMTILAELDKKDSNINKRIDKRGGVGNWFMQEIMGGENYGKQWDRLKNGNFKDFLIGTPPNIGNGGSGEVKMENNVHIHTESKDPKEHAAIFMKEVSVAYRQMNQAQVG